LNEIVIPGHAQDRLRVKPESRSAEQLKIPGASLGRQSPTRRIPE
jgi:hypothetical protein